jgi:phosphoribosyl-AMP cyclohydrolase / phosphoribosyl-ATP pyrophosphohydrolase
MTPNFTKTMGLIPVIIQDASSFQVLMLGYMNEEAFNKTKLEQKVTFLAEVKIDCGQKVKLPEIFYGQKACI